MENSLSLLELFEILEIKMNIKMNYRVMPWRISDQKIFVADNKKITSLTGWKPQINSETGINNILKWINEKVYCN